MVAERLLSFEFSGNAVVPTRRATTVGVRGCRPVARESQTHALVKCSAYPTPLQSDFKLSLGVLYLNGEKSFLGY